MGAFVKILRAVDALREFRRDFDSIAGVEVGLVMTMGALHDGHRSLIARARRSNGILVVSIFVNPRQFGQGEDLERYPRPLENDLELCRVEGVDCVFVPEAEALYPPGFSTQVVPDPQLTETLCGLTRPGHFGGVATVVTKVMNLVRPHRSYFGQKDAQQVAVIRQVARDLELPGQIVVCPIVREASGLALSSRNTYLSTEERQQAHAIVQALSKAQSLWTGGVHDAESLVANVRAVLACEPGVTIEYVAVVEPQSLQPLHQVEAGGLLAVAAQVGKTRLIDNVLLGQTQHRLPIIAIDGPAGAGKSTVARRLAQRLGFLYMDTGAMYRAVTWKAIQLGIEPTDEARLTELTRKVQIRLAPGYQSAYPTRVWVDGEEVTREVRDAQVSSQVSAVSSHLGVRTELVEQQRQMGSPGGAILDGRDIGTHVFPDAELKIYLVASAKVRAMRRAEDLRAMGLPVPERSELEALILGRDAQDSSRQHAPLRRAPDALEFNTDNLSVSQTVEQLLNLYWEKTGRNNAP